MATIKIMLYIRLCILYPINTFLAIPAFMNEQTHDSQAESLQSVQSTERGGLGAMATPQTTAPTAPLPAAAATNKGVNLGTTSEGVQNTIPPQNVGGLQLGTPVPATQAGSNPTATTADTSQTSSGNVPNQTGIPDPIKAGAEKLSGIKLDNVRVKYNSSKPSLYNALGIAIDDEVHLSAGQEHLLPHELYHIIQQAQGKVEQTNTINGLPINDNPALEKEAVAEGKKIEALSKQDLLRMPTPPKEVNLATKGIAQEQLINYKTPDDVKLGKEAKGGNEASKQELLSRDNNRKDESLVADPAAINDVQTVAEYIDNTVQLAARTVAKNPTLDGIQPSYGAGYLNQWRKTYKEAAENPAVENGFMPSRLGYAVETMAIHLLQGKRIGNYSISTQVTSGATRPDIVVSQGGKDVAWLDITAANSVGHIYMKQGGQWDNVNKIHVGEILYPSMDNPFSLLGFSNWQKKVLGVNGLDELPKLSKAEQAELDKAAAAAAAKQQAIAKTKAWVEAQFKQLIRDAGTDAVKEKPATDSNAANSTARNAYTYLMSKGMVHNPTNGYVQYITQAKFKEYVQKTTLYQQLQAIYLQKSELERAFYSLACHVGHSGNILQLGGKQKDNAENILFQLSKSLKYYVEPATSSSSSSSSSSTTTSSSSSSSSSSSTTTSSSSSSSSSSTTTSSSSLLSSSSSSSSRPMDIDDEKG